MNRMYKVRAIVTEVDADTGRDIADIASNLIGTFEDRIAAGLFAAGIEKSRPGDDPGNGIEPKYLVYRIGDMDDYHCCDDFDALVGELAEFNLTGRSYGRCHAGMVIPDAGFDGYNHISLFWGDEDAELARELTDDEYLKLFTLLEDYE